MEDFNSILKFLDNRCILVTGATGFLAKVFIEKILRVQPDVKRLYLLLRAVDHESAMRRFRTEVIEKELFAVVKEKYGPSFEGLVREKISVIAGDIAVDHCLGLKGSSTLEELYEHVEVVVNLAATTDFDERLDISIGINTIGAANVLSFSKRCSKLRVLLHVSTAYVCGEKEGLILEKAFEFGETLNGTPNFEIEKEIEYADAALQQLQAHEQASQKHITVSMKDLGIQRARKYGWPNTYAFTKAMGEMLLGRLKGDVPLVIVRPTIITSTYKDPFPGWLEGVSFTRQKISIGTWRRAQSVKKLRLEHGALRSLFYLNGAQHQGMNKHKLLGEDILPAMASNRKVQRLLNEFIDLLSEYEIPAETIFKQTGSRLATSIPNKLDPNPHTIDIQIQSDEPNAVLDSYI